MLSQRKLMKDKIKEEIIDNDHLINNYKAPEIIDFDDPEMEKDAKEYFNKVFEVFDRNIDEAEKLAINNFMEPNEAILPSPEERYDLDNNLQNLGGNIDARPLFNPEQQEYSYYAINTERYKSDIKKIDKTFSKYESKLPEAIYIYQDLNAENWLRLEDKIFRANSVDYTLDVELIEREFIPNFTYFKSASYFKGNTFSKNSTALFKIKIKIPENTRVSSYIDSEINNRRTLLTPRDSIFKVNKVTIISPMGIPRILIEAEIITNQEEREIIEQGEREKATAISNKLYAMMGKTSTGLPQLFEFHLKNSASSLTGNLYSKVIEDFESYIKNSNLFNDGISKDIFDKLLGTFFQTSETGKITVCDHSIVGIPGFYNDSTLQQINAEVYRSINDNATGGLFDTARDKLDRIFMTTLHIDNTQNSIFYTNSDLIHEFGHVFDRYCGREALEKNDDFSSTFRFQKIYDIEKDNSLVSDYGKTNPQEYMAEFFKDMVILSVDDQEKYIELKNSAKYTEHTIKDLINNFLNEEEDDD